MVLQAVCSSGCTFLRPDWYAAKQTNKKNISSLTNLNKNRSRYYFHTKKLFFAATGYSMPKEYGKLADDKSPSHLDLHMNKSSLSYDVDD